LERGADFVDEHVCPRFFHFIDRRDASALDAHFRESLDVLDLKEFASGNK
jgi:hypothetical protein